MIRDKDWMLAQLVASYAPNAARSLWRGGEKPGILPVASLRACSNREDLIDWAVREGLAREFVVARKYKGRQVRYLFAAPLETLEGERNE